MRDKLRKTFIFVAIIWIATLIGVGVVYFFVINPQKTHIKDLVSKLENEIETNLVTAKANEKRAKELMDARIAEAADLIDNFIVHKTQVTSFVFDFNRMASANGINDFTGSHDPTGGYSSMGGYKKLSEGTIKINFSGDYIQFVRLLNSIERYKPVVFVDRFDITRSRRQDDMNNINMTLNFYITK